MFSIDNDMTISITRGDVATIPVSAVGEAFKIGDIIRIKVFEKKNCANVIFQKDFGVAEETENFELVLTRNETKIGETINKPKTYWYEIELNPDTNPNTIVGYDEDGPKLFVLYPEGEDIEYIPPAEEEIGPIDYALSLTSKKPIANYVVAKNVAELDDKIKKSAENEAETRKKEIALELAERKAEIAVERARIDQLIALPEGSTTGDAELIDARIGADGTVYKTLGEAMRTQIGGVVDVVQIVEPINLFDKNNTLNQDGYIIQSKGALTPASGYTISHPIKAEKGVSYTYYTSTGLGQNAVKVGKADETGAYFDFIEATDNGDGTATFTINDNFDGVYFMINIQNDYIDTFMIVKGYTMPSEYIPYTPSYRKFAEDVDIFENVKNLNFDELGLGTNILYGKKLSLNGDSICYGAGATGGYGKIIADNWGMVLQNIARSGGTITAETYASDGTTPRHWICRTIENMDADSDYVIVEGGVNDSASGVNAPLGTLSTGYNAPLDDTTFYGAFESMCKQLLTRFAGKKVGYIAVHKMTNGFSSEGDEATNYYWASKRCCEKWGIPFLDLNISLPPFGMITESNTELYPLRETYTYNGDGWHPNEECYKKYYVPKIVAWLKSLGEDENTETLNQIEAQLDEIIETQNSYIGGN